MPSTLPDVLPNGVDDVDTLRWAIRSDGASAWVFVDWQQPHVPLDTYRGARFAIGLDAGTVMFPHEPVDVPPGTIAHWPVHLELGGVRLRWVTASPLTVLGSARASHPGGRRRGGHPRRARGRGGVGRGCPWHRRRDAAARAGRVRGRPPTSRASSR